MLPCTPADAGRTVTCPFLLLQVACETPKAAASLGTASVQHQGSNMQQQLSSAPAPASKRAKEWRLLPFLPERLAASARLLACATGRFQAGKLS